jgi:hypothetical protein
MISVPRRVSGTVLLALLCIIPFVGCGKSGSPTSPAIGTETASISVSAATAYDALSRDLQVGDSLHRPPCTRFGLPLGIPFGCPWDAATLSFICTGTHDGLTDVHGYQFLDAAGTPQEAYDSLLTASIRFHSSLTGTSTRGPSSTVDDVRDLVESGMARAETTRVWNGTGTSARQDSVRASDSTLVLMQTNSSTAVSDVVVPKPWMRDSWPLSGTVTTHLVATCTRGNIDVTSVLTFNGTRYATLAVGDSTYTVDLASPPCGKHGGSPPPPGGGGGGGRPVGRH